MAKPKKIPARPDTWMPIYWGDYFKDTNHLSTLEHGAYLLLISHYWSTGKALPDDDDKLAQISRQSVAQWRKMRPTVAEFFILDGGRWHHKRVESELTRAFDFLEKQRENGGKGGRPLNPKHNPNETQPVTQTKPNWVAKPIPTPIPTPIPNHNPRRTTSPSPSYESESSSSEISTGPARGSALDVGSAPRAKGPSDLMVAQLAALRRHKVGGTA